MSCFCVRSFGRPVGRHFRLPSSSGLAAEFQANPCESRCKRRPDCNQANGISTRRLLEASRPKCSHANEPTGLKWPSDTPLESERWPRASFGPIAAMSSGCSTVERDGRRFGQATPDSRLATGERAYSKQEVEDPPPCYHLLSPWQRKW